MVVAGEQWSKEAKFGDRKEAKRLGWATVGKSQPLTGAILSQSIERDGGGEGVEWVVEGTGSGRCRGHR